MKLIQQLRPYTTRVSTIRIPPKGVFIISFSEFEDSAFETIWSDIFTGAYYSYLPVHDCGIKVSTKIAQTLKSKLKRNLYLYLNQYCQNQGLLLPILLLF